MAELARRIHLDPLGGIAGDMFAAAMVDTFPQLEAGVLAAVGTLPAPRGAVVKFQAHRDAVLGGRRFVVTDPVGAQADHHRLLDHDHPAQVQGTRPGASHSHAGPDTASHAEAHAEPHAHTDYASIRSLLDRVSLAPPVRGHAHGLFRLLAEAEASVHGIEIGEVTFHEVGAWDSIVDFVAAAYLIDAAGTAGWTWSALPIGGGRIRSAHGMLPVPAPATALLMRGMSVVDDGITGERVTPTGAAILCYLRKRGHGSATATPVVASTTGYGFGTRTLPGVSNVLRCIAFDAATDGAYDERVTLMNFEIDDQSGEDLAVALDRLRATPGVLDVMQSAVIGKKGRLVTAVQMQVRLEQADAVADLVFLETTTIGLRLSEVSRRTLPRVAVAGQSGHDGARAKVAHRPNGVVTAKAEIDDVAGIAGHAERERVRAAAAAHALRIRPS
jgi:uncharacterized protein (TIGR00299 family) protein